MKSIYIFWIIGLTGLFIQTVLGKNYARKKTKDTSMKNCNLKMENVREIDKSLNFHLKFEYIYSNVLLFMSGKNITHIRKINERAWIILIYR